jgi:hypothetical protein
MAVKKTKSEMTANELLFCVRYVEMAQNGTRAYMSIYPNSGERAATTSSGRMLAKAGVRSEIARLTRAALKAGELSAEGVVRAMSWMADFDIGELSWKPGEADSLGRLAHVKVGPRPEQGIEGCPDDCSPHVGVYKPVHEMTERARKMIREVKFDSQGRKSFVLWSKESAQLNISKYHKLLVDRVEVANTISLADRIKAARHRALLAATKTRKS